MSHIIACHECDMLHKVKHIERGAARCLRCSAVLYESKKNSINRASALTLTALILFIPANLFPFLSLTIEGQENRTTLLTGIKALYLQGMPELAFLVFLTVIAVPLFQITGLLYIFTALRFKVLPSFPVLFRYILCTRTWGMMEIFFLGILVSVVKLAGMAKIIPGPALYSFFLLIFAVTAAFASIDDRSVWERFDLK